ncbi:virulence factor Mce family protein [Patulibacter medicamentivorans]|uniref:Virulence factor Mce family protein n=1 Tax=Patulibacter medicamentivorans TaxID=1097667 RepID=H0E5Y0_9ACTN|nr:MlaD family protein [Patulibacter medicamentivorans]EHN10921.1 virulence factor Mce family protein [Patulibacter medicamentivorans]
MSNGTFPTAQQANRRALVPLLAALVALLLLGIGVAVVRGDGGDDGAYRVRAEFDNGSFLVTGEDVKVAGVLAGTIEKLELSPQNRAVAVLKIDDPAFVPFRADATCAIGLQSLIGEQYVDCKPTQPRAEGRPLPPKLAAIGSGDGKGQHLLPVEQTTSAVGIDLIGNINQLPQRERLRLIVAEFGAGVAGNGETLRKAIIRANPALQQADKLVSVLARQNQTLDRLVADSDAVLRPLAERRKDLTGAIDRIGDVSAATAERGDDLERDIERLPAFLAQLEPGAKRISALIDQADPAIANLSRNAPQITDAIQRLGPFSKAATPAFVSLGKLAERGRTTFPRIRSLVDRFAGLGTPLRPAAKELSDLFGSLERAGGIESLMQLIYFYTGALNGFDGTSHYMRASLLVNNCIDRLYKVSGSDTCSARLKTSNGDDEDGAAARASYLRMLRDAPPVPVLPTSASMKAERAAQRAARRGEDPAAAARAAERQNTDPTGGHEDGAPARRALPGDDPARVKRALDALLGDPPAKDGKR